MKKSVEIKFHPFKIDGKKGHESVIISEEPEINNGEMIIRFKVAALGTFVVPKKKPLKALEGFSEKDVATKNHLNLWNYLEKSVVKNKFKDYEKSVIAKRIYHYVTKYFKSK